MIFFQTDVTIVGAGPAGVMAAVQLVRFRKRVALLEPAVVGGLLHEASSVDNFPGFPDGVEGKQLALHLARHLERFDIDPIREAAEEISWEEGAFSVRTARRLIRSPSLVVASGTSPRAMPIAVPGQLRSHVHSGVAALDGLIDAKVAIVGGGDAAFDYALRLAGENDVHLLLRSRPSCLEILQERALHHPRIHIIEGASLTGIDAEEDRLRIRFRVGGCEEAAKADHLLFAIGRVPNDHFLHIGPGMDENIQQERLHLVGDVRNERRRQAAIAAGEGLMAAMAIAEKGQTWS